MPEFEQRVGIAFPTPRQLFTPAVTVLLVLMMVGYVLTVYATGFMMDHIALTPARMVRGQVWQLLTYPFVAGCPWNFIFDCLILLFIGSSVEREWRTGGFVVLWLVVVVTCGVIWTLANLLAGSYIGISAAACSYGLIGAFGLLYRRQRFFALFWAIEAQYLAWIMIGIGIILAIRAPITLIWVAGALVAYLYVKLRWRISAGATTRAVRPSESTRARGFVDID